MPLSQRRREEIQSARSAKRPSIKVMHIKCYVRPEAANLEWNYTESGRSHDSTHIDHR